MTNSFGTLIAKVYFYEVYPAYESSKLCEFNKIVVLYVDCPAMYLVFVCWYVQI